MKGCFIWWIDVSWERGHTCMNQWVRKGEWRNVFGDEPSETRRKTGIGHVKATSMLAQRRKEEAPSQGDVRAFKKKRRWTRNLKGMEKIRWKIYRSDSMYVKLIFLRKKSTETENKTKIKYWIMDTDRCLIHWLDAKDIGGKTEKGWESQ